jgi:hypothetical protein
MEIVNLANNQIINTKDSFYYSIENFGIFKIKVLEFEKFSISNKHNCFKFKILEFKPYGSNFYYKKKLNDYFIKIINIKFVKSRSLELKKDKKNFIKDFKKLVTNLKEYNAFFNFINSYFNNKISNELYNINTLYKDKEKEMFGFNFLKVNKNILDKKCIFINTFNISKTLNNLIEFDSKCLIDNIEIDNTTRSYKLYYKNNNLDFTLLYIPHFNCCGFAYVNLLDLSLNSEISEEEVVIAIINFIFSVLYKNNKSINFQFYNIYDYETGYIKEELTNKLVNKLCNFKNVTKINSGNNNNNKFLITL